MTDNNIKYCSDCGMEMEKEGDTCSNPNCGAEAKDEKVEAEEPNLDEDETE